MKKTQKKALAVGAGVAALAAAGTAAYFLTGKRGAKNRKKLSQMAAKAQKDMMVELNNMEKVTKQNYHKAVDTVAKRYQQVKGIDKKELAALVGDMKNYWDDISSRVQQAVPVRVGGAKKTASKKVTVKKAPAKKSAKKRR